MSHQRFVLQIRDLRKLVKIGCLSDERNQPQWISLDILIEFAERPLAAETDELDHTVCYEKLSLAVDQFCKDQEFRLIEYLGWKLHERLRYELPKDSVLNLRLTKLKPPVDHLEGGAAFIIYGEGSKCTF